MEITTITLNYEAGPTVPDNQALAYARKVLSTPGHHEIGSDLIFTAMRVLIKQGIIQPHTIKFVNAANNQTITVDSDGRVSSGEYPGDVWDVLLMLLVQ